jgi:hypothetical protein
MVEPIGERPDMPEGYLGAAPLPWKWAEEQLAGAHTVQFSSGAAHGPNIARDPRVTVNLDDADECVIVEGIAHARDDEQVRRAFVDAYSPKYHWPMTLEAVDVVYVVQPALVFGWFAHDIAEGETLFQATATRWRFPGRPAGA